MRDLAAKLKVDAPASAAEITRARQSFVTLFWNAEKECLFDCVFPDGRRDPAIRPNQILAVGLPHPALTGKHAAAVLRMVQRGSSPHAASGPSRPTTPATAAGTSAGPTNATPPITRAPCGRGSWHPTSTP